MIFHQSEKFGRIQKRCSRRGYRSAAQEEDKDQLFKKRIHAEQLLKKRIHISCSRRGYRSAALEEDTNQLLMGRILPAAHGKDTEKHDIWRIQSS